MVLFVGSQGMALNYSQEVKKAQQWVDGFELPYPVIVLDHDRLNYLFILNGAVSTS